ncbi:hypothetical protein KSF_008610 [Reticulibacter mediterranei]|uniref:Uncharacterized protein n=1 Tax=Reticulibacter mediterranei TaxID=2778369 RepID=A0A8J3IC21_9CHLR|nr:hypothetical protein KSF_008610 [Reticulibacter mediterranei]
MLMLKQLTDDGIIEREGRAVPDIVCGLELFRAEVALSKVIGGREKERTRLI